MTDYYGGDMDISPFFDSIANCVLSDKMRCKDAKLLKKKSITINSILAQRISFADFLSGKIRYII